MTVTAAYSALAIFVGNTVLSSILQFFIIEDLKRTKMELELKRQGIDPSEKWNNSELLKEDK